MLLSRNQFFLVLAVLAHVALYMPRILWINHSERTFGLVWFMGHTLELNGSISGHLVILFQAGKDSVTFNTADNWNLKVGDTIPVRYQKTDPSDAKVDIRIAMWGDIWVNSLVPELVLLILFVTPNRFDPLIPWKSKIRIGIRPFLKIIPPPLESGD